MLIIQVLICAILSFGLLVESGGEFGKFDQPVPIEINEDNVSPPEDTGSGEECPFSHGDIDWPLIEFPHSMAQLYRLPMMRMVDRGWQVKEDNKRQQFYDNARKRAKQMQLEGRKSVLEKKFHYKSKLAAPNVNVFYKQERKSDVPDRPESVHQQPRTIVTMFANQKTIDKSHIADHSNELTQQQDLLVQSDRDLAANDAAGTGSAQVKLDLNYADEIPSSGRARESFQAAAELAKQLEKQEPEMRIDPPEIRNLTISPSRASDDSSAIGWDAETVNDINGITNTTSVSNLAPGDAKFLGFGELHKSDNTRSTTQQAILSCSFGLEQNSNQDIPENVTISDVEWVKFVGNYDPDQAEPAFECKFRTCRMMEVKNDLWTTVHPRPAVQQYIGSQAQWMPDYSITIHQLDPNRHIGVYRCSAIRQVGDKKQLVYRVVPLT